MSIEAIMTNWAVQGMLVKVADGLALDPQDKRVIGLGRATLGPKNLARRLHQAAEGAGARNVLVAISVLCTATFTTALPFWETEPSLRALAEDPEMLKKLRGFWEEVAANVPHCQGTIDPLLHWMDDASAEEEAAARRCLKVMVEVDIISTAMNGCQGDILGATVWHILHRENPRWPAHSNGIARYGVRPQVDMSDWSDLDMNSALERTESYVDQFNEGDFFGDMSAHCGTIAIALALQLWARGKDPEGVKWHLIELNAYTGAVCAINLAIFGLVGENVTVVTPANIDDLLDAAQAQLPKNAKTISKPTGKKKRPPRKPS